MRQSFVSFFTEKPMNLQLNLFKTLSKLFANAGYSLYLVGGTVRDFLLRLEVTDMDAVTDATPDEMKDILADYKVDYTFSKFGSVKLTLGTCKFDITTLRKETGYFDSRHPEAITFVKDLKIDVKRRDFTVNAMYLDSSFQLIDLVGGQEDLNKRVLRMVGNPAKRLKEDPLRIVRAARFALTYKFSVDNKLKTAILDNVSLLDRLNPQKVKQDLQKIENADKNEIEKLFTELGIKHLLDMLD